jgi:hypothetical protein
MRQFAIYLLLLPAISLFSQDVGKVVIKNAKENYPKFIVSLNGIRSCNEYSHSVSYNFLDEYNYKVSILQAGSKNTLTFMVYNTPNYVSTYLIGKDSYGNYMFTMDNKVLMNDTTSAKLAPSAAPATSVAATPGSVIDEEEYFDIVRTLKKETVEKNRLELAKTFFSTKWLLASMVKDALKMFNLEVTRVAFAKFAYSRTVDKQNYFKVFDAFTLSNSKKEMNEFIKMNP